MATWDSLATDLLEPSLQTRILSRLGFSITPGVTSYMTNKKLVPVLVGQLLVDAGMLDSELLDIALERARENSVRIGQILLYSGLVSDRDLKAALMAQRMLRQSLISYKNAVDALVLVRNKKMDYEAAFARARWLYSNEQIHQFAKLLMDVGLISPFDLGGSLAISIKHNYALGRVLMIHNRITMELRKAAIDAVIMVRCSEITYDHAVAAMKAVIRTGHSIRDLLGLEASPVQIISDELIRSGVLTQFEVVDIIEEALQREALWKGTVSADSTIIANLKFAASLSINRMVADGTVSISHAQALCNELLLSTTTVLKNLGTLTKEAQLIAS